MNSMREEPSIEVRLETTKSDFRRVLETAIRVKNAASGTKTDRFGVLTDTLLLRNILTGITIHQVLYPSNVRGLPGLAFPDFPSVAVLARTILECYLVMHCMSLRHHSHSEGEIRLLWWDWHEINERIRALDVIKSELTELAAFDKHKSDLAAKIRSHAAYGRIPKKLREGFENGHPPKKSLFESNADIANHAGILIEHFKVQYQFLSSVAHSQPTIVKMLSKHDPNAPEAPVLLIEALQYSTAYLAFTVRDFAELCPQAKVVLDFHFQKVVALWAGVFATPFPEN